jgi:2-deoxy-D-gluconate 3-dehydrogenase
MNAKPLTPQALSQLLNLKNQSAIVTGGGKGIGQAIACRLSEAGCNVVVVDADADATSATVAILKEAGGQAIGVVADVSSPAAAGEAVEACRKAWGGVDVLVNNAGIFPSAPALAIEEGFWDKVLDVNLKGAFFFSQAAARLMIEGKRRGSIVQIASIDALHPTGNLAAYDASKGGLVMLTRSLAKELGPQGVRVNAICPGGVTTPGATSAIDAMAKGMGLTAEQMMAGFNARIPLGRMGEPDDIALAALYLASPLSAWVTGSVLVVDGGMLLT